MLPIRGTGRPSHLWTGTDSAAASTLPDEAPCRTFASGIPPAPGRAVAHPALSSLGRAASAARPAGSPSGDVAARARRLDDALDPRLVRGHPQRHVLLLR